MSALERAIWVAVSIGSFPTLVNGLLNHIEPFVWALLAWSWLRLGQGDERNAGILCGVAGSLKLFPLALIPMLFAAGYRRAGIFALGSALLLFGVSTSIVGFDSLQIFVYEVLPQSVRYRYSLGNVSAVSLLARLVSDELALLICGIFLLWTIYLCHRYRSPHEIFVLGVSASLLCSPLSWTYYLIAALPCIMIATTWLRGPQSRGRLLVSLLLATLVYWPWILGGWFDTPFMDRPSIIALNYIPTLGLLLLWMLPQRNSAPFNEFFRKRSAIKGP